MKQLTKLFANYRMMATLFVLNLICNVSWAQDSSGGSSSSSSSSTTTTTTTTETWYTQPWVWIVGGAVLILLLVALLRGGGDRTGRSDKVTVTKSVRTDSD